MQHTEALVEGEKKKVSPLLLVVGGILAVAGLFLFLPSSRSAKAIRARQMLAKEFAGPKDLSKYFDATGITESTIVDSLDSNHEMRLSIFAPKPSDMVPSDFFEQGRAYRYMNKAEASEWVCILAPDPSSSGWTLFSQVLIGERLQKVKSYPLISLAAGVSSANPAVLSQLKTIWAGMPAEIQTRSKKILDHNRQVVKGMGGSRLFYQTGNGVNYEIPAGKSIWEFDQALQDAYPSRKSK